MNIYLIEIPIESSDDDIDKYSIEQRVKFLLYSKDTFIGQGVNNKMAILKGLRKTIAYIYPDKDPFDITTHKYPGIFTEFHNIYTELVSILTTIKDTLYRHYIIQQYLPFYIPSLKYDYFIEGYQEAILKGHKHIVDHIIVLPDNRIVSASQDRTMKIWNNKKCQVTLTGHTDIITCLIYSSEGKIVSGSADTTIRIWNDNDNEYKILRGHTDKITCLVNLPDNKFISGSKDSTLRVWNSHGECEEVLTDHTREILSILVSKDIIVSASCDFTVKTWNFNFKCQNTIKYEKVVTCMALCSDKIIIAVSDKTLRILGDLVEIDVDMIVNFIGTLSDGRIVYTGKYPTTQIGIYDFEKHNIINDPLINTSCIAILPDDRIITGSTDNKLRIWNPDTLKCELIMKGHTDGICCIKINKDVIVTGSWDTTLQIWR